MVLMVKMFQVFRDPKLDIGDDPLTPYVPWSRLSLCWGWETSHLLIGNPYDGYINPYEIGLMTIPYYMEIMGV